MFTCMIWFGNTCLSNLLQKPIFSLGFFYNRLYTGNCIVVIFHEIIYKLHISRYSNFNSWFHHGYDMIAARHLWWFDHASCQQIINCLFNATNYNILSLLYLMYTRQLGLVNIPRIYPWYLFDMSWLNIFSNFFLIFVRLLYIF